MYIPHINLGRHDSTKPCHVPTDALVKAHKAIYMNFNNTDDEYSKVCLLGWEEVINYFKIGLSVADTGFPIVRVLYKQWVRFKHCLTHYDATERLLFHSLLRLVLLNFC
ncbi:unnamed protein product [Spodoptera exigua]|nr:unnamed protein product [Spodoptera exigua]